MYFWHIQSRGYAPSQPDLKVGHFQFCNVGTTLQLLPLPIHVMIKKYKSIVSFSIIVELFLQ